jgi:hypothetical protein
VIFRAEYCGEIYARRFCTIYVVLLGLLSVVGSGMIRTGGKCKRRESKQELPKKFWFESLIGDKGI